MSRRSWLLTGWMGIAEFSRLRWALVGMCFAIGTSAARGQCAEEQKLTAADGAASDFFGAAVSVSGDTAVVGARLDDDTALNAGSAYVFILSGGMWTVQQKLTAADGMANDNFGIAIAVSGDTAVVGAPQDDGTGSDSGSAYVFVRSAGVWTPQQKLTAADAATDDRFGASVSVSGDTAVIGARLDDDGGSNSGSAYVFVRSGGVWTQQQKLTAADAAAEDRFGFSVSVSGDTAVVGAQQDDGIGSDSGSAYVFVRSGVVWIQQQKLTAADEAVDNVFGTSVSVSGDTAVIGAPQDDDTGSNSGSAYVFVRSAGVWTQQQKLTAADAAADDNFGTSVSVSGDTAVVGAFGDDDVPSNSGSAYVFARSGTVWTQQPKLVAADAAATDIFGIIVSVSGDTVVVGASQDDDNGSNSGSAYVFQCGAVCSPPDCNSHGTCVSGSCVCDSGFTGVACDQCATDYYNYPTCTFCLAATTCSGNGTCDALGACACNTGFAGTACDQCATDYYNYPTCTFCQAATTCSGNGTCDALGACACTTGFAGTACDQCATDYYNYPTCTFCQAATTCSGNGTCDALGACACTTGFAGVACDQCATDYYNYPTCTFCQAATTCSGNGTCDALGACACTTGFAGVACDQCATDYYNYPTCTFCEAATTCSDHGTCNALGGCDCDTGYVGAACDQCATDYYNYPTCTFCEAATTCSGNGTCDALGACACNTGFSGVACDQCATDYYNYPTCTFCEAATTCSGNGTCDALGACACDTGFTGAACDQCATDYYNYPTCTFCEAATTCSDHGTCNALGGCDCDTGYVGAACDQCATDYYNYPTCTFCEAATTCSGHGACNALGGCNCDTIYAGTACDQCAPNHFNYPICTFCDPAAVCSGNGTCDGMGGCNCNTGFAGAACDQCATDYYNYPTCTFCLAATTCSGNGTCDALGACACNTGFAGTACDQCATDYYNYPTCTFCQAATTCSGNGTCDALGACACNTGFAGVACDQCATDYYNYPTCTFCLAATTCSGNGTCDALGACACNTGFAGTACNQCATDYYNYPTCTFCQAATTCSGNGTCDALGACACNTGFAGVACDQCATDYYNYPTCTFCEAVTTCSGNGTCDAVGACACDTGFAGVACDQCATDYYNYPTCTFCEATTTCSGNGTCNALGGCDCDTGWSGVDCATPTATALTPSAAPAPFDRRKNRYISFAPNNPGQSVAFRVQKTTAPTGSCWVQAPVQSGNDQYTANCDATPVFRVWTEPVVHVGDCAIIPVADYTIFANAPGPIENPVGLIVPTILLPSLNFKLWGDNVGSNNGIEWTPPNQISNVNDVLSLLANISDAAIRPHFTVVNLQAISSADSCLNAQVNASDVLIVVQAVAGNSYGPPSSAKITDPALCPVCP